MDGNLNEKFQLAMPVFETINSHYIQRDKFVRAIKSVDVNKEIYDKKSGISLFITNYSIQVAVIAAVIMFLTLITGNKWIAGNAFFVMIICGLAFFCYKSGQLSFLVGTPPEESFEKQVDKLKEQITGEETAIRRTYSENKEIIEFFPPDYRYSHAINSIYKILLNGRADTMKEAINMFETDEFQRKMLSSMQEIISLEKEQVELMKRMAGSLDVMNDQLFVLMMSNN